MDYTNEILNYIYRASNPENPLFTESLHERIRFDAHLLEERNRGRGFSNDVFWGAAEQHLALVLREKLAGKNPIGSEAVYADLKWCYGQLRDALQPSEHDGELAEEILLSLDNDKGVLKGFEKS